MSDHLPRSQPENPFQGYPALGAVHDVVPNDHLDSFQTDFRRISDYLIKCHIFEQPVEPLSFEDYDDPYVLAKRKAELPDSGEIEGFDPRNYYKFFYVDTLGVSVVEMDPSAKAARAMRSVWERQDFGAVEQEAQNASDREMGIFIPKLRLNGVRGVGRRLPGFAKGEVRQKLALIPDTSEHVRTQKLIEVEADKINDELRKRFKQFLHPWDTFPHVSFAVFRQKTPFEVITAVETSVDNYMRHFPFEVTLGRLAFRHAVKRSGKK